MTDTSEGTLADNFTAHGSYREAYAFIEDRDLDSLSSYVRASSHVKYTCVTASKHLLCLGTSNGMVIVFQRDSSLKQQALERAASPNAQTAACAVTLLRISPDEKNVAAARRDGGVSIIDLNPLLKALSSVRDLAGRHKCRVTDMVWSAAGRLFIGDEKGSVHSHNSSLGAIFNSVVELVRVDSSVVQLDCFGNSLLISTFTYCYILNLSSKVKTLIGKQPRKGPFGACFLRMPGVDTPSIYCARRSGRFWEADFSGNVLNTHELQEARALPAAAVLSYRMWQHGDGASSNLPSDDKTLLEHRMTMKSRLTLGRMFSLSSNCLLSHSESHVCIVNPISAALILWTDFFKGAVDVFCLDEDIYVINLQGDQLREIRFSSLSHYLERSMSVVQPPFTGSDSCGVRAIVCCRLCLDQTTLVKDMLEGGRLQPSLLVSLCRALEQVLSLDCDKVSLMSEFRGAFGKWINEETHDSLSVNDRIPLQSKQAAFTNAAVENASQINGNSSIPRAVSTDSIGKDDDLTETGTHYGQSSYRILQTEVHHDSPLSDDVSLDRISLSSSAARSDTDPEVQSIVSYPGSELSYEANLDQHNVQVYPENVEASPPSVSSARSTPVNRLRPLPHTGKSTIDSFLSAKDRIKSVLQRVLPVGSRDLEQPGTAAEVTSSGGIADSGAASFSLAQPLAGIFGQQQQQLYRIAQLRLLEQTHRVWSVLRAVCGGSSFSSPGYPDANDQQRRDLLSEQLATWCGHLINVRSAAVSPPALKVTTSSTVVAAYADETDESDVKSETTDLLSVVMRTPVSTSANAISKQRLPSWRLQPVNVTWPMTLTEEDRRSLASVAMLYVELGCPPVCDRGHGSSDGEGSSSENYRDGGHRCHVEPSDKSNIKPPSSHDDSSFFPTSNCLKLSEVPCDEGVRDMSVGVEDGDPGAAELPAGASAIADTPQQCSLCHDLSCALITIRTCWFMRSFFSLLDVKRLSEWIARLRCGLECWKCFVSCLEEAASNQDQGTTVLQTTAGSEPLSADEMLRGILNRAKLYVAPVSSHISILSSDIITAQVHLTASRLFSRSPEKVVSFCAELRHFIQTSHVRYMMETAGVGLRYFVTYMDRIMQSFSTDAARDAFVHDQCRTPATGRYWLKCVLASDSAVLSDSAHCRCCRMIRPAGLSLAWPHKGLIDSMLSSFVRQSDAASSDCSFRLDTVASQLKDYGYWRGYIYLSGCMQRTEEVWKCLLQNGDLDTLEQETCADGTCLTLDEWPRMLRLRQNQDCTDVSMGQTSGCLAQEDHSSSELLGSVIDSDVAIEPPSIEDVGHYSPHHYSSFCPTVVANLARGECTAKIISPVAMCLFCGARLENSRIVPWDGLLLLFVKRHGFSRMWPLLQQIAIPCGPRTLHFYKLCLLAVRTEILQRESIEEILEVMNSYLWSKRPDYAAPEIRFRVEHQPNLASICLPKAASAAGRLHAAPLSRGTPRLLLDDPSFRWGASVYRVRCPLCNKSIVDNPSSSGDGGATIFDCGHMYHRHCLLDDRVCLVCVTTCPAVTSSRSQVFR